MTVNHPDPQPARRTPPRLVWACAAEAALAFLAAGLAWMFEIDLARAMWPPGRQLQACLIGLAGTAPMVAFFAILMRTRWRPLANLRREAQQLVGRLLGDAPLMPLIAIAVLAGIGEEMLFRGVLQELGTRWIEPVSGSSSAPWTGWLLVSVLFGLAHPISRGYVAIATLGGLYLGLLTLISGEALSATVAHALYDIVALYWLSQSRDSG